MPLCRPDRKSSEDKRTATGAAEAHSEVTSAKRVVGRGAVTALIRVETSVVLEAVT